MASGDVCGAAHHLHKRNDMRRIERVAVGVDGCGDRLMAEVLLYHLIEEYLGPPSAYLPGAGGW